ncbi:ferredoxin [Rhizobium sp. AQ_MP]|uniref:ferredoxin n=1 Tax=Rhizobium sp. AQ_MP TaxID=2761536 RepID=UPI001639AA97|nr:ferredoxin [Rhizobium sp. AQ_MP]MBC2773407.1 ferredoxin [Rhizobium sp. AQ_MP]
MSGPSSVLTEIEALLAPHGLSLRGLVRFGPEDAAPMLDDGARAEAVLLIGAAGGAMWPHFERWRMSQADRGGADPLDRWSKIVIDEIGNRIGAEPCYPSDPPYQPFQRWAMQAEGLEPSPLGILIHPRLGLWHSYRGALMFRALDGAVETPVRSEVHPCDTCRDKPCLSTCPVGAVSPDGFDVAGCRRHLVTPQGQGGCMTSGCLARNACPVGDAFRYPEAQLKFHMEALRLPGTDGSASRPRT